MGFWASKNRALCWKTAAIPHVASPLATTQSGLQWHYSCGFGPRCGVARNAPHALGGYRRYVSRCKQQLRAYCRTNRRRISGKKMYQERKISPKSKFWGRTSGGRPCRYPGGRLGGKNFGQTLEILGKQAFWWGRP